jgi:hypothetical protein
VRGGEQLFRARLATRLGLKREANVTSWPLIAPLPTSNVPDPLRRSPSQVAWAVLSIAI